MILYFNPEGKLTTIIPHGTIPRQCGELKIDVYFDESQDLTDKQLWFRYKNPRKSFYEADMVMEKSEQLVTFQKITSTENIGSLISGKKYQKFSYDLSNCKSAISDYGNLEVIFMLRKTQDVSTSVGNVSMTTSREVLGKAQIYLEETAGLTTYAGVGMSYTEYQSLLNTLNSLINIRNENKEKIDSNTAEINKIKSGETVVSKASSAVNDVNGNKIDETYAKIDDVPTKTSDLTNDGDGTEGSKFATEKYVSDNGGKIDKINKNGTELPINNKTVNIEVPTKISELTNDSGFLNKHLTKEEIVNLIGNVTTKLDGLMSAEDKTRLNTLYALLGAESDADNVVNTINEVLAIFSQYPEGADLVSALGGKVDKVFGMGLSTNDFTDEYKETIDGLSTVAKSGSYNDLKNKPTLFSRYYDDLFNKPTIPDPQIQSDWEQTDETSKDYIKNKPSIFSGDYNDLSNKPTIFSGDYNDLENKPSIPDEQIQADWEQDDSSQKDYIKNKPLLFTWNYEDLDNKPYIPNEQIQSDWEQKDTTKKDYIKNKPTLFSGSYNDLKNKPSIPSISGLSKETETGYSIDVVSDENEYKYTFKLKNKAGTELSSKTIDLPLESVVVGGEYDSANKEVVLHLKTYTNHTNDVRFSVADLVSGLQNELNDTNKLSVNYISGLHDVATSGDYTKLINRPDEAIAGKVNTADIVDNLTSTATDKPLSAKQGYELKQLISNINLGNIGGTLPEGTVLPEGSIPVTSVAGKTGEVTLDKSDVGLGNVGNYKAVSVNSSQGLTDNEKANARNNIDAAKSDHTHSYYTKASSGIPKTDLASAVQTSLGKADTALQPSDISDWAKASSKPSYTASDVGLGNVGNFKAVSTVASQGLSDDEKTNARNNIGAAASSHSHPYYTKSSAGIPKSDLSSGVQTSLGKADTALQSADISNKAETSETGYSLDLTMNNSTYVITAKLKNKAGTVLSTQSVDLPLESVVVNGSYNNTTKKVTLTLQGGSTVSFSVADLVSGLQNEINSSNKLSVDYISGLNDYLTNLKINTNLAVSGDTETKGDYALVINCEKFQELYNSKFGDNVTFENVVKFIEITNMKIGYAFYDKKTGYCKSNSITAGNFDVFYYARLSSEIKKDTQNNCAITNFSVVATNNGIPKKIDLTLKIYFGSISNNNGGYLSIEDNTTNLQYGYAITDYSADYAEENYWLGSLVIDGGDEYNVVTPAYVEEAISTKQDKITSTDKLSYSLISGTPGVFSTTANGLAPSMASGNQDIASGSSSSPMRVLASDGKWRLLPTNAYNNTTYSSKTAASGGTEVSLVTTGEKYTWNNLVLNTYPVGSIYMSVNSTSPASLFGGTWVQLKDRFLIGAGGSYSNGSTGGSTSHNHSLGSGYAQYFYSWNNNDGNLVAYKVYDNVSYTGTFASGGQNGFAFTTRSCTTGIALGGSTDNTSNLPPYLAVYMWKRTA